MTRKTGIDDEAQIIQESGSNDITADLGQIQSAGWTIEDPSERKAGVGSGASFQANIDGLIIPRCSVVFVAQDLEVAKLMGSLSSGTITFDDILPKHTQKMQVGSNTVLSITGVKYGRMTLNVNQRDLVIAEFEGIGTDFQFSSGTISTPDPSGTLQSWLDAVYKIDGTAVGSVESAQYTYERSLQPVRGIEDTTSGQKRLPSEIIEKIKDFRHDATIEIEDDTAWKKAHDDSSLPIDPQDSRTDKTTAVSLDGGGEMQLSQGRFVEDSGRLNEDKDVRTVDISGNAIAGTVTGL